MERIELLITRGKLKRNTIHLKAARERNGQGNTEFRGALGGESMTSKPQRTTLPLKMMRERKGLRKEQRRITWGKHSKHQTITEGEGVEKRDKGKVKEEEGRREGEEEEEK